MTIWTLKCPQIERKQTSKRTSSRKQWWSASSLSQRTWRRSQIPCITQMKPLLTINRRWFAWRFKTQDACETSRRSRSWTTAVWRSTRKIWALSTPKARPSRSPGSLAKPSPLSSRLTQFLSSSQELTPRNSPRAVRTQLLSNSKRRTFAPSTSSLRLQKAFRRKRSQIWREASSSSTTTSLPTSRSKPPNASCLAKLPSASL